MAHSIFHYGPLPTVAIVGLVFTATLRAFFGVFLQHTWVRYLVLASWLLSVATIIGSFLLAIYLGGGHLKKKWVHGTFVHP